MPTPLRVLILEDRPADAELILHELHQAGFDPEWQRVETEEEYLAALHPALDIILSDYKLPQFDGLSALRLLQARGLDIPFILVSGTIGEDLAVECIKQGADDYLLKDRLTRLGPAVKSALEQKRLRVEQRRMEREIKQNSEDLTLINTLNKAVNRGDSLQNIVKLLSAETRRIFACSGATVYLLDEDKKYLVIQNLNISPTTAKRIETLIGMKIPGTRIALTEQSQYRKVLQAGKPQLTNDPQTIQSFMAGFTENELLRKFIPRIYRLLDINSMISIPLISEGEIVGLLEVSRKEPFTDSDVHRFAVISEEVSTVIQRKQAEETIRRNEALLLQTSKMAKIGGWELDLQSMKLLWSQETYRIHEADPSFQPDLEKAINFYAPEARPIIKEAVRRASEEGTPYDLELPFITAKGRHIWVRAIGQTEFRDGKCVRLFGAFQDITERKQTEEALRKSEAELKEAQRVGRLGSWDWNAMADTITWSEEYYRIYGFDPKQPPPGYEEHLKAYAPESAARLDAVVKKSMETGEPYVLDLEQVRSDGTSRWITTRGEIKRGANDQIIGLRGTAQDITERKRSEEALRQSEERFRNLYENSSMGIYRTTPDGRILLSNPAIVHMLGYESFEELARNNLEQNGNDAGYQRSKFREMIERDGEVRGIETEWKKRDGTPIFIRENARLVRDDVDGKILYYDGTVEDITERKRAEERIKRQLERLTALNEIDRMITSSFDLHLSLASIVDRVISQQKIDAADILVMNPDLNILEFGAGQGFRISGIEKSRISLGQGYAGRAALDRKTIHIPDLRIQTDKPILRKALADENFVSHYAVPLIAKGKVKGVLEVFHRSPLDPDFEWLDFLNTLAGQAAIAIDNATLFGNLQRSNMDLAVAYNATIEGWSHALDLRDKETEGHTQRVTEMSIRLAQAMGISDTELVQIRRGALLHDIGKMGVPDGILLKPDKLTDEEWVLMKKHPQFAYDMLAPIAYLKPALDIPYCHHEKWDGTGYPRGLKGEQIPLAARLFAVVDVYDALRSDRPYRAAWTEEQVREHIRTLSGTHFDPQVIKAFMEMLRTE